MNHEEATCAKSGKTGTIAKNISGNCKKVKPQSSDAIMVETTLKEVSDRLNQVLNSPLTPTPSRSVSLHCLNKSPVKANRNGDSLSNASLSSYLERGILSSSVGSFSMEDVPGSSKSRSFWGTPKKKKKKKKIPFLPPLLSGRTPSPMVRNLSCHSLRVTERKEDSYDLSDVRGSITLPGSLSELNGSGVVTTVLSCNGSVLPPISTKDVRSRSFLVGRVTCRGSLLGGEEMIRHFPERKMKIFVGTWNMNGQSPPSSLNDFLLPESNLFLADMYVVGTQEGISDKKEWEISMQACLGPSHVLFHSTSLGVLHLAVFLRRDLIWFCSVPEDDYLSTRPGTMVKTKGAIAISFVFFGISFLFINSHLTAHEKKIKERVADYEKIINSLSLPKNIPLRAQYISKDVTARFDYVFWCGDLNFRLDQERSAVIRLVENTFKQNIPCYQTLLQHDQLKKLMDKAIAFRGFQEGHIQFGPSYKFDSGSMDFDTVKQRVPSYTDRILYRTKVNNSVKCCTYSVAAEVVTSDHRPVFGIFDVNLRPGRDDIPLAAGLFVRDIYVEGDLQSMNPYACSRSVSSTLASNLFHRCFLFPCLPKGNKRRAKSMALEMRRSGSVVCSLM